MLDKKVTKLWQGRFVSIRDYELQSGIDRGGLVIRHNNQKMIIGITELRQIQNNIPFNNPPIKSKTGGKNYRLVDIPWRPVEANENQKELFNE